MWLWRREHRKRGKLQEQVDHQAILLKSTPPTYETGPVTKTVYAHAHVHEIDAEPPAQELEAPCNEAPDTSKVNLESSVGQ
jgi:hypothetical protein